MLAKIRDNSAINRGTLEQDDEEDEDVVLWVHVLVLSFTSCPRISVQVVAIPLEPFEASLLLLLLLLL